MPSSYPTSPMIAPPLHYGSTAALVQWAVERGKIAAVDSAAWLGLCNGPGGDAYCELLAWGLAPIAIPT